jgi:L-alanine-DL-glutamate epimerase-like enolase superfamily enzyme
MTLHGPLSLRVESEQWPLEVPFRISGRIWEVLDVIHVTLEQGGHEGCGEAAGVYFRNESVTSMVTQIESVRTTIESGISRAALQDMLPPGGARNALDCALWDLEAKLVGHPVWHLAGLSAPQPLVTTFGCGADSPESMASVALAYTEARAIKLKLTGEPVDAARVSAVREARPDVWLGVDANQGFTRPFLEQLMPALTQAGVALIEQPFPVGQEAWLDDFNSPIAIAADESVRGMADLPTLAGRFSVVNIKLDKSGGLTEALAMARACHELGLDTMVGNMFGTSLAMAPAFLVGQLCKVVDLDGAVFLQSDRADSGVYRGGTIMCSERVWGASSRIKGQPGRHDSFSGSQTS